jgi:hypothetical protein
MSHRRGYFTYEEAVAKLGAVVEACFDIAEIPAGTVGTVVRVQDEPQGCAVVVAWRYQGTPTRPPAALETFFGYYTYSSALREL